MANAANFFKNSAAFVRALFTIKIFWKYNICRQDNCEIHERSVVNGPYNMFSSKVGMGTYISANSRISMTTIGKFCSIGPNFFCGFGIHPINGVSTSPAFYSNKKQVGFTYSKDNKVTERKPITIGNDVFIGLNVTVLDGITIGDGAVIGAGSVVSKDIPPYAVAVGCPIQIIKYRFEPEVIERLLKLQWWDKDEATLQKVEKYFFDVNGFIDDHANGISVSE